MDKKYTEATRLLDFKSDVIHQLVSHRNWQQLSSDQKIRAAYEFVRDEIKFGYNSSDDLTASAVLEEGYGQCNTKAILLMALLRSLNIPCRLHGFTIDKKLQKGAITGVFYFLSPRNIIHSWVEVFYEKSWI